jgi:hypothetical protein
VHACFAFKVLISNPISEKEGRKEKKKKGKERKEF